jgi:lipoprotein-anchoring transpeptidase ErfK/SrfK
MKAKNFFFPFLIVIGLVLVTARPAYAYTVRQGDTLSLIAKRFGVSQSQLLKVNRIKNSNLIYIGQRLVISQNSLAGVWVEVSLREQKLYLYRGEKTIFKTSVSAGLARYPTPIGRFKVWTKLRLDDMQGGSRERGDYYYLPKVPYVAYFYQGYALHGTYWHKNFGRPMFHGCINLSISDASHVYSQITVGTPVIIHSS